MICPCSCCSRNWLLGVGLFQGVGRPFACGDPRQLRRTPKWDVRMWCRSLLNSLVFCFDSLFHVACLSHLVWYDLAKLETYSVCYTRYFDPFTIM